VWQLAKIDFHIPFAFSLLLKRINLRAFTENKGCGKQGCHTGSSACQVLIFKALAEVKSRQAEQAAEKVDYFVIPSEARNLSWF
jgi:hypothetical protein